MAKTCRKFETGGGAQRRDRHAEYALEPLSDATWRNRLVALGPAHRPNRHPTDRTRRTGRPRASKRLHAVEFSRVFTSPLQRARRTCELAGLGDFAEIEPDLAEWDYGEYEGLRPMDIRKARSDWNVFRDGCPGGVAARWIGLEIRQAQSLHLSTASISILGYEHNVAEVPAIVLWNVVSKEFLT